MSINSRLRNLRLKSGTGAQRDILIKQLNAENNDRGAAILGSVMLEDSLRLAVDSRLMIDSPIRGMVYENNGPLSTFDGLIIVGRGLRIYGGETLKNLNIIKHVRNTFAHASLPVDFATPEIVSACESLSPGVWRHPRKIFLDVCMNVGVDLARYALDVKYNISTGTPPNGRSLNSCVSDLNQ